MKSASLATLKAENAKLTAISKAVQAIVESDEMDADEANELLDKEVEKLNAITDVLAKLT
jgi:hypothetical protein